MTEHTQRITVEEWDRAYERDSAPIAATVPYLKPIGRYVEEGDSRLTRLRFDPSPASLWLWNFLLSEDHRLERAVESGHKLVGTMKDLGTIPIMSYSLPNLTAFYPDGAWWIPCIMEANASAPISSQRPSALANNPPDTMIRISGQAFTALMVSIRRRTDGAFCGVDP